jgi:defect-in-organelle-trafficking protein DotC
MRLVKFLAGVSVLALLAGCQQAGTQVSAAADTGDSVENGTAINAGNSFFPMPTSDKADATLPTLTAMEHVRTSGNDLLSKPNETLRVPAIRDAALSYGVQGGLAWSSRQIDDDVKAQADHLTQIYDFNQIMIRESGGVMVQPPVISASEDTYQQSDFGRTLRVADSYYQIIKQAQFAPVSPLWYSYLVQTYNTPQTPPDAVLPKNDAERELWIKYVDQGWQTGVQQGQDIFKANLDLLNRDYDGMVRYAVLLHKGEVSPPVVAGSNLGTTGSGQDMRQNDQLYKITQEPSLNVPQPDHDDRPAHAIGHQKNFEDEPAKPGS